MFDCDTLWCCWLHLLRYTAHGLYALRYGALAYASLYALGALAFLTLLRIRSVDGKLTVSTKSWAYMIAHPLRYGGHRRSDAAGQGSICAFYARMFNMLLFVWPFLLLWFVVATVVGNTVFLLLFSCVMVPDLSENGFMRVTQLSKYPSLVVTVPLALAVWAGFKWAKFIHLLAVISWATLCISPAIILAAALIFLSVKVHTGDSDSVNAALEFVTAKKERFCKLIEFH